MRSSERFWRLPTLGSSSSGSSAERRRCALEVGRGCRGSSGGCAFVGSGGRSPRHAVPRVNPEPPCRRPRLAARLLAARSTRDVVNAPASPSEVTLPAEGPGGSGGSPPPGLVGSGRRAWQDRSLALGPAEPGSQGFRAPGSSGAWGRAGGGGPEKRPGSVKPHLVRPGQPRAPQDRGGGAGVHVGDAGPAFFCCEATAGLPSPPPANPKGLV